MANGKHRCGIYVIEHLETRRFYIGRSADIEHRWYAHRRSLGLGTHHSRALQEAWIQYGEAGFGFYVLDECPSSELIAREQEYLDAFQPAFNTSPRADAPGPLSDVALAKLRAVLRARAAAITHCPKGHPYDETNTYRSAKAGKRICRVCNAERVSGVYAKETPEDREVRRQRAKVQYEKGLDRDARLAYAAAHREEKRAYDKARRAEAQALRRARIAVETPEQREHRLAIKRASHHRNKEHVNAKSKAWYEEHKAYASERDRLKRESETPEQREARLAKRRV